MEGMKEEERKKYEEELEAMKKKHKDHKPVSWEMDLKKLSFFFSKTCLRLYMQLIIRDSQWLFVWDLRIMWMDKSSSCYLLIVFVTY